MQRKSADDTVPNRGDVPATSTCWATGERNLGRTRTGGAEQPVELLRSLHAPLVASDDGRGLQDKAISFSPSLADRVALNTSVSTLAEIADELSVVILGDSAGAHCG